MSEQIKKPKRPRVVTNIGTVVYAWLDKPSMKYKAEKGGEYSVTIRVDAAYGKPLYEATVKRAKELQEKAIAEAKDGKSKKAAREAKLCTYIEPELDKDGNETGSYLIVGKQTATITMKPKDGGKPEVKNITIPIVDAKRQPIAGKTNMGRGSKVKLALDLNEYTTPEKIGVAAWLVGVQIIELVKYSGGASVESLGFGEEEGYVATESGEDDAPFDASEAGPSGGSSGEPGKDARDF